MRETIYENETHELQIDDNIEVPTYLIVNKETMNDDYLLSGLHSPELRVFEDSGEFYLLNPDGSIKLDEDGKQVPVPEEDDETIFNSVVDFMDSFSKAYTQKQKDQTGSKAWFEKAKTLSNIRKRKKE